MKFSQKLYTDEAAAKAKKSIIHKLRRNRVQPSVYVIVLNLSNGRPEMFNSAFLKQKYYRKHPPYIIGIAMGSESAMQLLGSIVVEGLSYNNAMDFRESFMSRRELKKKAGGVLCRFSS